MHYVSNNEQKSTQRGRGLALLAILAGAALGIGLGAGYGRTMWLASGGVERKLERLRLTAEQKEVFAQEALTENDPEEARRLRGHVRVIEEEIVRTEAVRDEAQQANLTLPRYVLLGVRFCGDVFLRALMLIVVPLVVTSMICGITSLGDVRHVGKVGAWTLVYYFATGAAAVVLGIVLVQVIRPGVGADDTFAYVDENVIPEKTDTVDTLWKVVLGSKDDPGSGMIPSNLFRAASAGNILGLILFSLLFGGALSTLGERGRPAVAFFRAVNEAVMKIVRLIIYFTPVGVFGLIATQITDRGGGGAFYDELVRLGWFVLTVSLGLAIHSAVLCAVLALVARRHPLHYLYAMGRALLTALSTDSSSATLPVTIECVEASGVSERAAGFVLPLGATINMDGTALYEATAAIFIAQSAGIPLSGTALVVIFLTATLAAIGAPGIPSAGLVTLLMVLGAAGLPTAGIGTILAIDWLVDRERTTVNVFGDAVGAAVIDRYLGEAPEIAEAISKNE